MAQRMFRRFIVSSMGIGGAQHSDHQVPLRPGKRSWRISETSSDGRLMPDGVVVVMLDQARHSRQNCTSLRNQTTSSGRGSKYGRRRRVARP